MRSSGVVQGLKSLASKLHPQLPLTARESNILLNTLTSSFRKHLDEIHPTGAEEETKSATKGVKEGARAPVRIHRVRSAAASADDHLVKLLTNPLLARRGRENVLDYDTAKVELAKSSSKDPIGLLERYQEKGAASVRIAELCLEAVQQVLHGLSADEKQRYIESTEPGRRALRWLLDSKAYETDQFWNSQNGVFAKEVSKFILLEGREENLWHWIALDLVMTPGPGIEPVGAMSPEQRLVRYAWRSHVLEAIVSYKLNGNPRDLFKSVNGLRHSDESLNAAIDVYIRACELKLSADRESHLYFTPLRATYQLVTKAIKAGGRLRAGIDVEKFNQLHNLSKHTLNPTKVQLAFYRDYVQAELQLWHPKGRRPLPIYQCFRHHKELFPSVIGGQRSVQAKFRFRVAMIRTIARAIHELRLQGHPKEAAELNGIALDGFPEFADVSSKYLAGLQHIERLEREDPDGAESEPPSIGFMRLGSFSPTW
ncbi:unnamed protein product [Zymoseptoria tritici ST99CH_1A5]|uniref:Uncharacterized protein n=2 Tax=Zymoseptoria tritici TaxID=1047171 RepID=A0A2H1FX82_ZYMTR|nr:unnamed protein product [Zymoseptoria tritici ST99CH_1E4]SMR47096.1 unnamed protein product [Zymoseptoria tritici ST99CH_3D1]SMY20997.1 unnamed protein product [Zymoseptoria tritici ST99CH_1A5]